MAVLSEDPARRAESLLIVAERHATGVPYDDLVDLVTVPGPSSAVEPDVTAWGATAGWTAANGRLFRSPATAARHDPQRAERGARYLQAADDLLATSLGGVEGLTRFVSVSGSVAFGEPMAGDDVDFFVVTRRGAVWPFLLYAYLAIRARRLLGRRNDEPSDWCFNYVLDEAAAEREFARARGFQFAREALMVRPIRGEGYYLGLLRRSTWMASEAPGFYRRWMQRAAEDPSAPHPGSTPLALRALNRLLHPILGSYLQLRALRDNHRLRRQGRAEREFEIITSPDRVEVRSLRFAKLAELYEGPAPRESRPFETGDRA